MEDEGEDLGKEVVEGGSLGKCGNENEEDEDDRLLEVGDRE